MARSKKTVTAAPDNVVVTQNPLDKMITSARKNFETDGDLETKTGVAIEVAGVGTFTILRTTTRNKKWTEAIRKRFAPHIESKDEEFRKSIEIGIFADTVIIGLKTVDGEKVTYDDKAKRAVKELLMVTPDLYELLQVKANDSNNFLKTYEAEAKN